MDKKEEEKAKKTPIDNEINVLVAGAEHEVYVINRLAAIMDV